MMERMNLRLCLKVHGSLVCTVVSQPLFPVGSYSFIFYSMVLLYGTLCGMATLYMYVCL